MTGVDGIPRLALGELDGGLQELLKPTVERLGYLGEFFGVAGHVPGAVYCMNADTAPGTWPATPKNSPR